MSIDKSSRMSVIEAITSPLGFFALALMIVESFLGLVLSVQTLSETAIIFGLCLGAFLFLVIIFLVFILTWKKPEHLVLDKEIVMETNRYADDSTNKQILLKYWMPSDTIHQANNQRLRRWLEANELKHVRVTFFINSNEYKDLRKNVIQDLNIDNA